jgi:hypothetical protein
MGYECKTGLVLGGSTEGGKERTLKGEKRGNGGELVQVTLYTCMELSQ